MPEFALGLVVDKRVLVFCFLKCFQVSAALENSIKVLIVSSTSVFPGLKQFRWCHLARSHESRKTLWWFNDSPWSLPAAGEAEKTNSFRFVPVPLCGRWTGTAVQSRLGLSE